MAVRYSVYWRQVAFPLVFMLGLCCAGCGATTGSAIGPVVVVGELPWASCTSAIHTDTGLPPGQQRPVERRATPTSLMWAFTEAFSFIERCYVDEVSPKDLVYSAIRGMPKAVNPDGSFVPPGVMEAIEAAYPKHTGALRSVFSEALLWVESNYANEVKREDLIYGAIRSMMRAVDPHGSFMPPDDYTAMQIATDPSSGVGIEIAIKEHQLTIVSPIEGSPADRGGIRAGDWLLKIDGQATTDMTLIGAIRKLQGPAGTQVTLTIMRNNFDAARNFILTREVTKIRSVTHKKLVEDIGYIRLRTFHTSTGDELEEALHDLEKQKTTSLVLDLRNNPGGLLNQAVKVAEKFLAKGQLIVATKGRVRHQNMRFTTSGNLPQVQYPIVVLVNGGSMAGGEIVAGALQDWKRASILGTPTFGRGAIQTITPLSDGSGLRLTTARAFTPQDRTIEGQGITPDIGIEQLKPPADVMTDLQLQVAVERLRVYLKATRQIL